MGMRHRMTLAVTTIIAVITTAAAPVATAASLGAITQNARAGSASVVTAPTLLETSRLTAEVQVPPGTPSLPSMARHVPTVCTGDGTDGNRVQVVYARDAGAPNRFATVEALIRNEVANVDDVFAASAAKTAIGLEDGRQVRWVTTTPGADPCAPTIMQVELPANTLTPRSDDSRTTAERWPDFRTAMREKGLADPSRKYLVFADTPTLGAGPSALNNCGMADGNSSDSSASMYARIFSQCWTSSRALSLSTHELMHTLGAVDPAAPTALPGRHCSELQDVMCYDEAVGYGGISNKTVSYPECSAEALLDCRDDTYFAVQPAPNSYVSNHWNIANSSFLASTAPIAKAPPAPLLTAPTTAYANVPFTLGVTLPAGATDVEWSNNFTDVTFSKMATASGVATVEAVTKTLYPISVTARIIMGDTGRATVSTVKIAVTQMAMPEVRLSSNLPAGANGPTGVSGVPFKVTGTVKSGPLSKATWRLGGADGVSCAILDEQKPTATTPATATIKCTLSPKYQFGFGYADLDVTQVDGQAGSGGLNFLIEQPRPAFAITQSGTGGRSLTATLTQGETPLTGEPVNWFSRPAGSTGTETLVAARTTDAAGRVTFNAPASSVPMIYTASFHNTDDHSLPVTASVLVKTQYSLAVAADGGVVTATLKNMSGAAVSGSRVDIQVLNAAGVWETKGGGVTSSSGRVSYTLPAGTVGTYRATYAGGSQVDPAVSASIKVLMPTRVTIAASGANPTYVVGTLINNSTKQNMAYGTYSILVKWAGTSTYTTVVSGAKADARGQFKYLASSARAGTYIVVAASTTTTASSGSPALLVKRYTTMSMTLKAGRPNVFTGKVATSDGRGVAGATVYLQRRNPGWTTWMPVATLRTNSSGYVSSSQQPKRGQYYRFVYSDDASVYRGATSVQAYVRY